MKKLRIVLLTVAVIMIAAGAAFATNAAKNTGNSGVPGYLFDEELGYCDVKRADCSPTGTTYCRWMDNSGHYQILSSLEGTTCEDPLYEPN